MQHQTVSTSSHRVVFVAGGIKLGGATTFLLNLGGELVRRGLPALVVSLEHENPHAADFTRLKIPVHLEDERSNIFEDRLSSAIRAIRQFAPTVVIATLGPSSYEVLRYLPGSIWRLAMLQSDFAEGYSTLTRYAAFVDGFIGVSRAITDKLRNVARERNVPVFFLPYGIDLPDGVRQPDRNPGEAIRILYLGRLCREQKRAHLLAKVFNDVERSGLACEWTIAGDGPELPRLRERMVPRRSNVRVNFRGAVNYADVPALLHHADVFLLVSDHEGLPLSLLEAMAHGIVPVVSNLRSGVAEVVDQTCGVLVDVDDVAGYATGIVWLAKNPAAYATMSAEAAARVRARYSVGAMTDRWLEALEKIEPRDEQRWPAKFSVVGPLGESRLWFSRPMRNMRRIVRTFSRAKRLPAGSTTNVT